MFKAHHALVLNMHQPIDNLRHLLETETWELKQLLFAYDRAPRVIKDYKDVAHVHIIFSGTLLQQLADPGIQERCYGIVKLGDMLWSYRNPAIELLATGYFHPVFPLIPKDDWDVHMSRWLELGRHLFDWKHFAGFWPPEMAFSMEMIPFLKHCGFEFVIVDSIYIEPEEGSELSWHERNYRPHKARYGDAEIIVVPRDRELSDAQESGMDPGWFAWEVAERTKYCDFPPLVTTCSDGDNGGWFRNTSPKGNFWGHFFGQLMDWYREGTLAIMPVKIIDYINQYPPTSYVKVRTGAWNTGLHSGQDFIQWTGSLLQRRGIEDVMQASKKYHALYTAYEQRGASNPQHAQDLLNEAYYYILRAQTSCNFYWGSSWIHKSYDDIERAERCMEEMTTLLLDKNQARQKTPRRSRKTSGKMVAKNDLTV